MDFSIELSDVGVGNTVLLEISDRSGKIELLGEIDLQDNRCIMRNVHVQGPGANTLGWPWLRRLGRRVKEKLGVEELGVEGATRTSGAGPGRRPRALVFR